MKKTMRKERERRPLITLVDEKGREWICSRVRHSGRGKKYPFIVVPEPIVRKLGLKDGDFIGFYFNEEEKSLLIKKVKIKLEFEHSNSIVQTKTMKTITMKRPVIIAIRVAPHIAELVKKEAEKEGVTVSVWIRNIISKELKKRGYVF